MPSRRNFLAALAAPSMLRRGRDRSRNGDLDLALTELAADPAPLVDAPPSWPEDSDPAFWDRVRDQFYFPRGQGFFNTGTIGATPRPVLERVIEDMRTLAATVPFWDYSPRTPDWISG